MKGAFEDNMKPVPSCAADSDAVAGQIRQALDETNRSKARTSAAMLGLAISMGASNLLVPQQGEAAVSNHLPPTDRENSMPASPIADLSSDLDPAEASALEGSEISQPGDPVSAVNQLQQNLGGVSVPDEPNITLKVREIGAIAEANDRQNPMALPDGVTKGGLGGLNDRPLPTENLSSIQPAVQTEAQMGKPEPSFLVASVSSNQPDFLFSGNPKTSTNLEVSLPSLNHLPDRELAMAPMEGTLGTPGETSQKTIVPGSGTYTAAQSDAIAPPDLPIDPARPLSTSHQNPAGLPGGINSELGASQINIEYSHRLPVPEFLSETEAIESFEGATEAAVSEAELDPEARSEEAVAREINSEIQLERSIEIKPVEFQFAETPLPLESNPEPEVVVSPDLTNAVVIESDPSVATASRIYKVDSGETLDAIARENDLSVSDLMAANQIGDPNFIKAQQKIKIPFPIDRENSTSLENLETDRFQSGEIMSESSVNQSSAPVVLGTDAIYPLAPRRHKEHAAVDAPMDAPNEQMDYPQNLGGLPSESSIKTPYANSLKADLEKLREKYPAEDQYPSQPELPIDSAWQSSDRVAVSVPDLPANQQPTGSAIEIAPASQYLASDNSDEIPQTPSNGYVEGLRADIERLRQNQQDREAAKVQPAANDNNPSNNLSEQSREIYSEQYSEESNQVLQAAIENKPEKRQRPATPSAENAKPTRTEEPTSRELLATGSSGTAAYQPLLQPTTGQMVSPQLPPLNDPDSYLPGSPAIFNGYIWPARGVLTSGYGWRWGRMHNGIDIAGPVGTPIFAAASGVVTYAGWNSGGYGNLVEIEHADGSFTVYAHNHRILVREGQEVDQGEQVAEMGSTGFSTGPHLHFEIHPSGQSAVNPMAYLPRE